MSKLQLIMFGKYSGGIIKGEGYYNFKELAITDGMIFISADLNKVLYRGDKVIKLTKTEKVEAADLIKEQFNTKNKKYQIYFCESKGV